MMHTQQNNGGSQSKARKPVQQNGSQGQGFRDNSVGSN
jgi:hypothetical protein